MELILEVENLSKQYGSHLAVDKVSFQVSKGKVYGLLGPNGSGKSTTLGMVLGVVNKTSGSFRWFDGTQNTEEALKSIGALIERPNFYPYMTAEQNLKLVCKIKEISYDSIEKVLEIVDLADKKQVKFEAFSLGMKQRLAIASALLNEPKMLILDEPTNGLDPQGIHQIRELILRIASDGTTILLASHLLAEVEKVCTDILIIREGKMLHQGSVSDLQEGSSYLELKAENTDKLLQILKEHPDYDKVDTSKEPLYRAYFKKEVSADSLNRYLMQEEVYLQHLVEHKINLEEYFLELTKAK